jgi:pimeloyl-ACP methyl ester carboxylesterase
MKLFGFIAAFAVAGAMASIALLNTAGTHPAGAQQMPLAPERPLVFVPGLLGSMLCRTGPAGEKTVVWGTVDALGQFPTLGVNATGDEVEPCGLIREVSFLGVFNQTVYGPFIDRLEAAGYREGETLFIFDYDWRLSALDNAKLLADYVDASIPGTRAVDIVGHSMGGLVARTYAVNEGGADRITRLVSAGTPWRGSVQVLQLLHDGLGLANPLVGGLENFRRTVISFPSTFELLPHYDGCCGDQQGSPTFDATSADAWTALKWPGIDKDGLPDFADLEARQAELRRILAQSLPASVDEALVIGVDQRTPEQFEVQPGHGEARLSVRTSWEGDGTVMRDSAMLAERVSYPTSFATHDAILNDSSVQEFVIATLAKGPDAAIRTIPVRERTSILTALGDLAELVGVAITTDQPAYITGATAKVTVHLRLDVEDPVEAAAIRMTVAPPAGPARPVALTPDPAASDPANPLEQSFSAYVEAGERPGDLSVTVTLDDTTPKPRTVTRVIPVLSPRP